MLRERLDAEERARRDAMQIREHDLERERLNREGIDWKEKGIRRGRERRK